MQQIVTLLTAFGLGSIMTAVVQSYLSIRSQRSERSFKERQAAYIGLLEAYHRAAIEGTDEAAKAFAYWQIRCEIVAPKAVRSSIQKIIETNGDPANRSIAHERMKSAIRTDLGIAH